MAIDWSVNPEVGEEIPASKSQVAPLTGLERKAPKIDWDVNPLDLPEEPTAMGEFGRGVVEPFRAAVKGAKLPVISDKDLAHDLLREYSREQSTAPGGFGAKAGRIAGSVIGGIGEFAGAEAAGTALAAETGPAAPFIGLGTAAAAFGSSGAYESFLNAGKRALREGKSLDEAVKIGRQVAKAGAAIGAGTALLLPGGVGGAVEKSILRQGGELLPAAGSALARTAKAAVGGAALGGGGQLAENLVEQRMGLQTPTFDGVFQQALTMGGIPVGLHALRAMYGEVAKARAAGDQDKAEVLEAHADAEAKQLLLLPEISEHTKAELFQMPDAPKKPSFNDAIRLAQQSIAKLASLEAAEPAKRPSRGETVIIGQPAQPQGPAFAMPQNQIHAMVKRAFLLRRLDEVQREFADAVKAQDAPALARLQKEHLDLAHDLADAKTEIERPPPGELEGTFPPSAAQLGTFESRRPVTQPRQFAGEIYGRPPSAEALPQALQPPRTPLGARAQAFRKVYGPRVPPPEEEPPPETGGMPVEVPPKPPAPAPQSQPPPLTVEPKPTPPSDVPPERVDALAETAKSETPKPKRQKKLLAANQISDFRPGIDRVERRGDRTFVVDIEGQRAAVEVQSDKMTPEAANRIRNLPSDKRAMARQTTASTPYLSPEGKAERLAVFDEKTPPTQPPAAGETRKGFIAGTAAEKWADQVLRGGGTHAGTDVLAAYIVKGAAVIERGIRDFTRWSSVMISHFGEDIRPHLQAIYRGAQEKLRAAGMPDPETAKAKPGEPLNHDALSQLTEQILKEGQASPKEPVGQRINDAVRLAQRVATGRNAVEQTLVRMNAAGTALLEKYRQVLLKEGGPIKKLVGLAEATLPESYTKLPTWTNYLNTIGRWVGANMRTAIEVRRFQQAINKAVPNRMRQEAMTNWIQADGDEALLRQRMDASKPASRRGYELALSLTEGEKRLAGSVRDYFDKRLQEGLDAGLLKSAVQDYITQIWKRPTVATQKLWTDLFGTGTLNPNFKYARKRIFESYFEGEQKGFLPKNKSVNFLLSTYDLAFNRALSARAMIKALHDGKAADGSPIAMISQPSVRSVVKQGQEYPSSYLIKPNIAPKDAVTKDGRPYMPVDHWALKDWKFLLKGEKGGNEAPVLMEGDMYIHPDHAKDLKNVLGRSALRDNPFIKPILTASAFAKQTKLSLSVFHLDQEGLHGVFHRVNPANLVKLNANDPVQKSLMDHGVMVADPHALELFAEGLSGGGLVGKIPGLGHVQQFFNDWLFREYIPRLKMTMAMDALKRNRQTYASEVRSGKITDDQVLALTAREANAAFGEQNYALMGRNKTLQDFLRLTLLAPDFLEARARFVAQALKPYGREQQTALGLMAATLWVGARIANQFLDNDPHYEKPLSVVFKGKEYRLRTVLGDAAHLIDDWRGFVSNRLSPTTRTMLEGLTKKDDRGIKRSSYEQLEDVAKWLIPIPLQVRPGETLGSSALASAGVAPKRYDAQTRVTDLAHQWMQRSTSPDVRARLERIQKETLAPSDYGNLRQALRLDDASAAKAEYRRLIDAGKTPKLVIAAMKPDHPFTGSKAHDAQFLQSLNFEQRRIYQQAKADRLKMYQMFLRLIGTAPK